MSFFRVKVLSDHIDRADLLAKMRLKECLYHVVRSKFDVKNLVEQNKASLRGALAEVLFSDVFECKIDLNEILVGKIDFAFNNLKIDVKCNSFDKEDAHLILFKKDLENADVNYFFLVVVNEVNNQKFAYFMGGINKTDFIKKCSKRNYGYGERFFVHQKELSFKELI